MAKRVAPKLAFPVLVQFVGDKKALELVELYGGHRLPDLKSVLILRRDTKIYQLWKDGRSPGELAAMYHMDRSNLMKMLDRRREEELAAERAAKESS